MDKTKWFCETGSECHTLKEEFVEAYNGKIHPATKEQREQFEKAMTDAGYTFDFEKKELKKIEQKSTAWSEEDEMRFNNIFTLLEGLPLSQNWFKSLKDRVQPQLKQGWSEEDENRINRLIAYFEDKESFTAEDDIVYANWLKSLKPQNRWKPSEEQISAFERAINCYSGISPTNDKDVYALEIMKEQLKKLTE
jgi:hypothetical protein